jgi:hypothetical protein
MVLGWDEVAVVVVAEVELDPPDGAGEPVAAGRVVVGDGCAVSAPTSVVSSKVNMVKWVRSTRPEATCCPSTYRVAVPPLPKPPPS